MQELCEREFYRDICRSITANRQQLLAPADGIILYAKQVESSQEIVAIKDERLSVNDLLMMPEISGSFIVIGIFMSFLDVHVNRMPSDGILTYKRLPALTTENLSMVQIEKAILQGGEHKTDDLEYLFKNARVLNRVWSLDLDRAYYMVQIADLEVDVIAHFYETGSLLSQGDRFAVVRSGSQVDLIIPLKKGEKVNILAKELYHVKAGEDVLVEFGSIA
jgi:phosphatidylserine decarboxylase